MFRNWQLTPVVQAYQQIMERPLEACRILLQPYIAVPPEQNGVVAPAQIPQQSAPAPQQQKPNPAKGNNGKQ
jgi:hypothetical protein